MGFQNLLSCVRCACYAPACSGRPAGSALLAGQLCPALTSSLTSALCWLQARCWRCGSMNVNPTDSTRPGHGCTSGRGRYAASATAPWMPFGHGSQACQRALSIPPSGPVLEACTVEATPTKRSSNWLAACGTPRFGSHPDCSRTYFPAAAHWRAMGLGPALALTSTQRPRSTTRECQGACISAPLLRIIMSPMSLRVVITQLFSLPHAGTTLNCSHCAVSGI